MGELGESKAEEEKQYKYDVVVTLGGGVKEHKGRLRTTNYSEGDDYGVLGARTRIIATEYLYEMGNIAENFLEDTGEEETEKKELLKRGLPEKNVYVQKGAGNTHENIVNMLKTIKEHDWKKILLVSSNYHIPRIQALYEKVLEEHKEYSDIQIDFQGAEDVLVQVNPKWEKYIDQANNLEEMKKRITNEEQGLKDLKENRYKL